MGDIEKQGAHDADRTDSDAGNSPVPKQSFGQKTKRHCAKWWWVHLIVIIIIALVVVLPVVFVGVPNIGRSIIQKSTLNILEQQILDPHADYFTSKITTSIDTGSPLTATVHAFNASISLGDGPTLYTLPIPEFDAKNGVQVNVDSNVTILNKDAFNDFAIAILQQRNLTVHFYGQTTVKDGALPQFDATFDKQIEVPGLDKLSGFSVTNVDLITSNPPQGYNTRATVNIFNPSPLVLQLGDVFYSLAIDGTLVGNVTIPNFTLQQGSNNAPAQIYSDQIAIASKLQEKQYGCGKLPFTMFDGKSTYEGNEVPYFTKSFQSANITSTIDLAPALKSAGLGQLVSGTCS